MKKTQPLRLLELFAGYGGLGLAVEKTLSAKTAAVAEWDDAPSKVLAKRFPHAPNLQDVTTANWAAVAPIDVISGGSPCQDLSMAGARSGMTEGTRSNLWVAQREAIALLRPKFVVWENVRGAYSAHSTCESDPSGKSGILRALGRVLGDMTALGYDAEWRGLRASDVGAPHARPRVFMLAWDRSQISQASEAEEPLAVWDEISDLWRYQQGKKRGSIYADSLPISGSLRDGVLAPRPVWNKPSRPAEPLLPTPMVVERQFFAAGENNPQLNTVLINNFSPTPAINKPRIQKMHEIQAQKFKREVSLIGHVGGWGPYRPTIQRWEHVTGIPAPRPTVPHHRDGRHNMNPEFTEWMMGLKPGWITKFWNNNNGELTTQDVWKMCGNGVVVQQATVALQDMVTHVRY